MSASLRATLALSLLSLPGRDATARESEVHPVPVAGPSDEPAHAATDESLVRTLLPGTPQERELADGATHLFSIILAPNHYARIVIEQPGVNVGVKLFGPDGGLLAEVNNWDKGFPETLSLVADVPGPYRIEIRRIGKDEGEGLYEVRIEELREATPEDRRRVAAEKAFAEGQLLRWLGTAEARKEAILKYEISLPLARAAGDFRGEAHALSAISGVSHELGENRKALDHGEQALALWRAAGDQSGEGLALNLIGLAWWSLNEYEKAFEHFSKAMPLYRAAGARESEATTLHNMGIIHSSSGEYQKALEHYARALIIRRESGDRGGEAVALNNMGVAWQSMGESQKALDSYALALPLRRAVGNRRGEGYTLGNVGDVYGALGEYQNALRYYNQALLIARAVGDRRMEASMLRNAGKMNSALGEDHKALEHYDRALVLYRDQGERRGEANALGDVGGIHQKAGEYRKAFGYHQEALTIQRTIGNRAGEAFSLRNIGLAQSALGETQKALEHYNQALSVQRAVRHRSGEAMTLFDIARAERNRGELAEARSRMESAIEIIESLRANVASQELRASFLASVRDVYGFYTDLLMQLHEREPAAGHDQAAMAVSEHARARSLLEILSEAHVDVRRSADPLLLEREQEMQQQINVTAARLTRQASGSSTGDQAAATGRELDALLIEYQTVRSQIRTSSPRYAALIQPVPLNVREIQQGVLDPDSLLLEYHLGDERSFLWSVTPNSFRSYLLPARAEIETSARRVYELLTARNRRPKGETPAQRVARLLEADAEYHEAATLLSRMLLGPVANQLGSKRLVIVSEGALQYVPFGALPKPEGSATESEDGYPETPGDSASDEEATDGRIASSSPPDNRFLPLIAFHEIASLPSASVLAVLRKDLAGRITAPRAVAVLADPVFRSDDPRIGGAETETGGDASKGNGDGALSRGPAGSQAPIEQSAKESGVTEFRRLRFSRMEADAIATLAPGLRNLSATDFAASRDMATGPELRLYRTLHFATHGLLNSQRPELSGIVLSLVDERGNPRDGFLRLHDIYNLELGAGLVVLSACQTALGKDVRGEGLVGLTRGFMYAGAPRVVASLWSVDDRATAELMKRFYTAMFVDGMRPAAALRAAQSSLRGEKGWESPYYWAGFTLQGEWR